MYVRAIMYTIISSHQSWVGYAIVLSCIVYMCMYVCIDNTCIIHIRMCKYTEIRLGKQG